MGVQSETSSRKVLSSAREMERLAARLDPAEAAAQKFARSLNSVARAAEGGYFNRFADGADRMRTTITGLQREFEKLTTTGMKGGGPSAGDAEASFRTFEEVAKAKATQIGQEFSRELNARIVEGSGKAARDSAAAFEENWNAQASSQAAFNKQLGVRPWQAQGSQAGPSASTFMEADAEAARRLTTEYDQLTAAQQRRDAALKQANELLARGAIEEQQHGRITAGVVRVYDETERALARTGVAVDKYKSGMGVARHEMVNFSRQLQDIGVSLGSGQSPFTVALQQGTQIFDIFSTSKSGPIDFFKQAAAGVGRFALSLGGAVTGAVGLGAALAVAGNRWAESQRAIETSLMGIGRGSGQTVDSINKIADAAANAGRISAGSARQIASAFAGTGQIDKSLISTNLVDTLSRGYGRLTDQSQVDAGKGLAQALASPTAGAQELEKRLGKLSDAQMEFIRTSEASGNKIEAQRALLSAINEPLSTAATNTSIWARAWEAVAKGASSAADAIGRAVSGPSQEDEIRRLQSSIDARTRRGQNFYGLNVGSSRSVIAQEQAELDVLLRAQRRNREAAEFGRAEAASNNLSRQAGGIARGISTDAGRRLGLEEQLSVLEKAFGDSSVLKKLGPTGAVVAESIERLKSSLENFETTNQRIARDFQLQAQQIDAYTLEQRAAVEAERARLEAIRAGRGELQAGVEAEQARTRTIMEANRQLRDTARDLKDAGSLIGLSPFQRSLRENANTSRRERETLTMSPGAAADSYRNPFGGTARTVGAGGGLTRDQTLDLIMQYESGGRNIHQNIVGPNGGYNPSTGTITGPSSAQGYFQMTNPTWRDAARMAGIDLKQFPTAMSASYEDQRKAAGALLDARGVSPWAPYNAGLRGALAGQGVKGANDNNTARDANTIREAYEGWNTPLANANRQLDANISLQQRAQQTYAMSTAEITTAAEKQKLLNEYAAQGIPITDDLAKGIDEYARRAGMAAQASEMFGKSLEAMKTVGDLGRDTIKGFYSDLRNGASGVDMLRNALDRIASKLLDMAVNDLFGKAFGNNAQGLFGGGGFFSGIGSWFSGGGGGGLGTTPGSGGLYADGGFTGHGSKWQPAGVVHRGEVVWSQADVSRAGGVAVVDAMRRGMPGYASGGSPGYIPPSAPAANSNMRPQLNVTVQNNVGNAQVETQVDEQGNLQLIVNQIDGELGRRAVRGQGALAMGSRQVMNNQTLRG